MCIGQEEQHALVEPEKTITLARKEEIKHFKEILKKAENSKQEIAKMSRSDYGHFIPLYKRALSPLEITQLRNNSLVHLHKLQLLTQLPVVPI